MQSRQVVTLGEQETVRTILDTLDQTAHNGFPVVDGHGRVGFLFFPACGASCPLLPFKEDACVVDERRRGQRSEKTGLQV